MIRTLVRVSAFWFVLLFLAILVNDRTFHRAAIPMQALGQCLLLMALLICRPIREFLSSLPKTHLFILVVFYALFSFAQLVGLSRGMFPFVEWNMYGIRMEKKNMFFYEYAGVDRRGNRHPLKPAQLFPPLDHGRLSSKMDILGTYLSEPAVRQKEREEYEAQIRQRLGFEPSQHPSTERLFLLSDTELRARMADALRALARAYDRKHPPARIETIEVVRGKPGYGQRGPILQTLWTLPAEGGPLVDTAS